MTGEEFLEALEGVDEAESGDGAGSGSARYFMFEVGSSRFALPPEAVREIVPDLAVYPLPACPAYVPGLVNVHGSPHAAIDLRVLFESERQEASLFLALNLEGDAVALGCTEVLEIAEVPESRVTRFAEGDAEARFSDAVIVDGDLRVPVLSVERILAKLGADLG
jgi:chemotaxis signal transduction protein